MDKNFDTFEKFYVFYLGQHSDWRCRLSHVMGINLGLVLGPVAGLRMYDLAVHTSFGVIPALLIAFLGTCVVGHLIGYGFAIPSHYLFEGNKPASFTHSWWFSYRGDWRMWRDLWTGKIDLSSSVPRH